MLADAVREERSGCMKQYLQPEVVADCRTNLATTDTGLARKGVGDLD
jgi:hypothetical protein